ncbi:6581_t:CDS:2, partial [Ambispora gerdemannii]
KRERDALDAWWEIPKAYQEKIAHFLLLFADDHDETMTLTETLNEILEEDEEEESMNSSSSELSGRHTYEKYPNYNDGDSAHSQRIQYRLPLRLINNDNNLAPFGGAFADNIDIKPVSLHEDSTSQISESEIVAQSRIIRRKSIRSSNADDDDNYLRTMECRNYKLDVSGSSSVNNDDNNNQLPDFINESDTRFTSATATTSDTSA